MLLYVPTADGKEVDAVSEKGKRMLTQMAQRVTAMMADNRWSGAWVQGVFDEPEDPFVDRYRVLIGLLRAVKPDIRILEATMTMNVSGLVNIWCPQVKEYQAHRAFFDGRKAAGDQVWVYTCLSPGGPWLNRLLDQERLRQIYLGWACATLGHEIGELVNQYRESGAERQKPPQRRDRFVLHTGNADRLVFHHGPVTFA